MVYRMTFSSLVIVAVMTMGGVEADGQLNLLFEGYTLKGNTPVLLAVTLPSELAAPRINGRHPIFGVSYTVVFSGTCRTLTSPTVLMCQTESITLRN